MRSINVMNGVSLRVLGVVSVVSVAGFATPALSQGHRAVVIADPSSAESLYVSNYYAAARGLPSTNVLYFNPDASDFVALHDVKHKAFLGELANRGIDSSVDFVLLTPDAPHSVSASGLVRDLCSPVNNFALASAYGLAPFGDELANGPLVHVSLPNGYKGMGEAVAFSSQIAYANGGPSADGRRSFIGAHIGFTGTRGNTLAEVLDTIDRGVMSDGSMPLEPVQMIRTTDPARSRPRDGLFAEAASSIDAMGFAGDSIDGTVPTGGAMVSGVMTGMANPAISSGDFSLVPGAYADHLTSYAGSFQNGAQTKMSKWISKGATLSSGAVEEPCNYVGKFASAKLFENAVQGLTLGESWYRSTGYVPFQMMLVGDPMSRPWGEAPAVFAEGLPEGSVSGELSFVPVASPANGGGSVSEFEVFVDGVSMARVMPGEAASIPTGELADGWHELRVVGYAGAARVAGEFAQGFMTDNHGGAASATVSRGEGSLTDVFTFSVDGAGGRSDVREVRLMHNGRVVGSSQDFPAEISLHGHLVGAGTPFVQAEIEYSDGSMSRSAPVALSIAYDESNGSDGSAPVAFSYILRPSDDAETFVVPLPADHSDNPGAVSYRIVDGPYSATILEDQNRVETGPYRVMQRPSDGSAFDSIVFEVEDSQGRLSYGLVTIILNDDCAADQNTDGLLTGADFNAFIMNFIEQDPRSDVNNDGFYSGADFTAFIGNFQMGCLSE